MNKLNLSQRKLNKKEVQFLLWFLTISNDNPIEHPVEDTVFFYDGIEYTSNDFKNLLTKLKAIHKSYIT
jgi:hypothetical protein